MPTILHDSHPIARKEHICEYCGCKISKGQKYYRQTCAYDGYVYDWVAHKECQDIAHDLDMFSECDSEEGLTSDYFNDIINDYINQEHYDKATDDVAMDWQGLTRYEEVCKILEELKTES